jgi:putative FmdB family regulatory protein
MPIYEYRCSACGHHLEALQKMTDAPLRKCPDCGKSRLKRLVSASQFRLKGSGWYETDFKGDKEKKRNLVEAAAEASDAKSDGAGTDAEAKTAADKAVSEAKTKTDGAEKPAKPKPPAAKTKAPAAKKRAVPRAPRSARA